MDERQDQRRGYPLTIPDVLLQSDAMRQACATRNFQEVFRLVNRRTGSSYAAMAAAVGKMTSSRVSDIVRGVRGIRGQAVIERIADGFGIPGEMLGLPMRPWEKGSPTSGDRPDVRDYYETAQEATDILPARLDDSSSPHAAIADFTEEITSSGLPDVLLVSVLIEGRRQTVALNRRELLARSTGAAMSRGFRVAATGNGSAATSETPAPCIPTLGISPFKGANVQQSGERLLSMFLHLDDELGGDSLFLPVSRYVARMAVNVRENPRDGLSAFGQLNQMAGWLALDANNHAAAKKYLGAAIQVGHETGDHALRASALAYMSLQETYRGRLASALSLAEEATADMSQITPLVRTMLGTRLARAHAGLGNRESSLKALDAARNDFDQAGSQEEPRYVSYVDSIEVTAQEGACFLDLGMSKKSAASLTSAIGLLSIHAPNRVRDRVHYLSRLAKCYLLDGEVERACQTGGHALELSCTIGSARVAERLGEFAASLAPYSDVPSVADFRERYRMATQGLT